MMNGVISTNFVLFIDVWTFKKLDFYVICLYQKGTIAIVLVYNQNHFLKVMILKKQEIDFF